MKFAPACKVNAAADFVELTTLRVSVVCVSVQAYPVCGELLIINLVEWNPIPTMAYRLVSPSSGELRIRVSISNESRGIMLTRR